MSKIVLGALALLVMVANGVNADKIAIYGDAQHSDCNVVDLVEDEGVLIFYVFHYSTFGALGSQFKAPYQTCLAENEYVGENHFFAGTIGNSQVGVQIPYGTCLNGWIHVLTIYYWDPGNLGSSLCCQYPVLPHPSSSPDEIQTLDCSSTWVQADGMPAIVNVTPSCPCEVATGVPDPNATWGSIKALFCGD